MVKRRFSDQGQMLSRDIGAMGLKTKRKPERIGCLCGTTHMVIMPNLEGKLVWKCEKCDRDKIHPFKPIDQQDEGLMACKLQRMPVQHGCKCGREDLIVLPRAVGYVIWVCKCGKRHRIVFEKLKGQLQTEV